MGKWGRIMKGKGLHNKRYEREGPEGKGGRSAHWEVRNARRK